MSNSDFSNTLNSFFLKNLMPLINVQFDILSANGLYVKLDCGEKNKEG